MLTETKNKSFDSLTMNDLCVSSAAGCADDMGPNRNEEGRWRQRHAAVPLPVLGGRRPLPGHRVAAFKTNQQAEGGKCFWSRKTCFNILIFSRTHLLLHKIVCMFVYLSCRDDFLLTLDHYLLRRTCHWPQRSRAWPCGFCRRVLKRWRVSVDQGLVPDRLRRVQLQSQERRSVPLEHHTSHSSG